MLLSLLCHQSGDVHELLYLSILFLIFSFSPPSSPHTRAVHESHNVESVQFNPVRVIKCTRSRLEEKFSRRRRGCPLYLLFWCHRTDNCFVFATNFSFYTFLIKIIYKSRASLHFIVVKCRKILILWYFIIFFYLLFFFMTISIMLVDIAMRTHLNTSTQLSKSRNKAHISHIIIFLFELFPVSVLTHSLHRVSKWLSRERIKNIR